MSFYFDKKKNKETSRPWVKMKKVKKIGLSFNSILFQVQNVL